MTSGSAEGSSSSGSAVFGRGSDLRIRSAADLTSGPPGDKIVKLPCWAGRETGWWEHPILENSTACTCQMPNYLDQPFWLGEIPLDQIVGFRIGVTDMSAMTSSFGQFKLAVSALFRLLQQYFFTERLILAQDERWRRA